MTRRRVLITVLLTLCRSVSLLNTASKHLGQHTADRPKIHGGRTAYQGTSRRVGGEGSEVLIAVSP